MVGKESWLVLSNDHQTEECRPQVDGFDYKKHERRTIPAQVYNKSNTPYSGVGSKVFTYMRSWSPKDAETQH
jgi:hypothetical protein